MLSPQTYARAVERAGAVPVLIPPIPCSTTPEVLSLFAEQSVLEEPNRDALLGVRPVEPAQLGILAGDVVEIAALEPQLAGL